MNTYCTEARSELSLYVGGDLEAAAHERVERHLEHCAACRAALERASAARGVLRDHFASPEIELHRPELWSGVRAALLEEGLIRTGMRGGTNAPGPLAAGAVPAGDGRARSGRLLRLVPLAAAAAGLFFLGTLAGRQEGGAPQPVNSPGSILDEGPSLVLDASPASATGLVPVRPASEGGLVPLGEGQRSLAGEARPWMGEVLPLGGYSQGGTSAAGFSKRPKLRADGVR